MMIAPEEAPKLAAAATPGDGPCTQAPSAGSSVTSTTETSPSQEAFGRGGLTIGSKAELEEDLPPRRLVLVVMIAVIQGYTLIGPLQHSFKVAMRIGDKGALSHVFTQAAALVQWGKFAMTLGQNVIFSRVPPLVRVYIAMAGSSCERCGVWSTLESKDVRRDA